MEIEQPPPPEVKRAIDESVQTLRHAAICLTSNCRLWPTCTTVKRMIEHSKICSRKGKTDCRACRALISLSYDHSKSCSEPVCPVPYCNIIRITLMRCTSHDLPRGLINAINNPVVIFAEFSSPHVIRPQWPTAPKPNQRRKKDYEELELPPIKKSPILNEPQQASPEQKRPAKKAIFRLAPLAPSGTGMMYGRFGWRRENFGGQALAGQAPQAPGKNAPQAPAGKTPQAPTENTPQAPGENAPLEPAENAPQAPAENTPQASDENAPEAAAGVAPQGPVAAVPHRIRVKKSILIWVGKMLYGD